MKPRNVLSRLGALLGEGVMLLVWLAAQLFRSLRLGPLLQSVSLPRLSEHRTRTSLTVLGVAAGVALLLAVVTVNESVLRGVADTVEDISGKADLEVAAGTGGLSDHWMEKLREQPGVEKVAATLQQVASILHPKAKGERVLVVGTDLLSEDDAYFRKYESSNLEELKRDPLAFLNSTTNILVGRKLADRLGLDLHDELPLATGTGITAFQVCGFLEPTGVGDAFDGAIAVMDYQAMQIAFSRGQNVDRIELAIAPGHTVQSVQRDLRKLMGEGFLIDAPSHKGEQVSRMLLGVRTALMMASLIALFVGAFLVYNTIAISVVQRKRELGTLRTLGTLRREVRNLVTLEGALLGLVGSLLGIGLGSLISRGLLRLTAQTLNETHLQLSATEAHLEPWAVAGSAVFGTLATAVAAYMAATRAARVSPLETLRTAGLTDTQAPSSGVSARDLSVLALLGGAWLLLELPPMGELPISAFLATACILTAGIASLPRGVLALQGLLARWSDYLGLETRLANANLTRDVGRTSTTAGALLIGVAMVIAFGTFGNSFASTIQDWVKQVLPGDLLITNSATMPGASSRNVPMADTLYDELLARPEVTAVRRLHVNEVPYGGLPVKLVSTDTKVFLEHASVTPLEGSLEDVGRGWLRGAVAVSENFSRRFDVHRGDHIRIPGGDTTHELEVAAVVYDYSSDAGTIIMERSFYAEAFADDRVGAYELYLTESASADAVRRAIGEQYGGEHDLFILTNQQLRDNVYGRTTQVFSLLRVLELVALLVAVLGLINALWANALDRVREIGVLRAVGMTRRSVRRLIMMEGLLIGLLGLSGGVAVGLVVGHIMLDHINMVSTGWHFPYRFSFAALLELSLLTVVASLLGGLYPARKAASLEVTDALGYE